MKPNFFEIYVIDNRRAVFVQAYARLVNFSPGYLIELIKKLRRQKIYIGVKWRKYWYIFLPDVSAITNPNPKKNFVLTELPSGQKIDVDDNWRKALKKQPDLIPSGNGDKGDKGWKFSPFLSISRNGKLGILAGQTVTVESSGLTPKMGVEIVGVQNAKYRATTEYSYGNYIFYDPNKMSTFDPGTAGTLKSTQLPTAFFEVCRALDAAENTRNGANPGLPARRNLSTTVSFDTGTIAVAATIPVVPSIVAGGQIQIDASDYLGSSYTTFVNGGGDLTSTNLIGAFLEMASLLAAAEKTVTPTENQPNNVQIQIDNETSTATVSANLPFTTSTATNGNVTIIPIDYL